LFNEVLLIGLIPVLFSFLTALVTIIVITGISIPTSLWLSRLLDRLTLHQVKQSAYGNELSAEFAFGASRSPYWITESHKPLPDFIGTQMSKAADAAAADSLSRMRRAIGTLAFSTLERDQVNLVEDYLTWNELIHTTYFKVPIFRKLVCYAIAQSPGFRPSEKLKADPDYEKLGQWLAEIKDETHVPSPLLSSTQKEISEAKG